LSKAEFEFPVVGKTPPTKDLFEEAIRQYRALGATLVAMGEEDTECHDQNEIAAFVVGLMFAINEYGAKSSEVYAYVRRTVAEKEFLTELASRIIVLYDVEARKQDPDQEVKDVRDQISRVRLD
jgi:hypothetical protein